MFSTAHVDSAAVSEDHPWYDPVWDPMRGTKPPAHRPPPYVNHGPGLAAVLAGASASVADVRMVADDAFQAGSFHTGPALAHCHVRHGVVELDGEGFLGPEFDAHLRGYDPSTLCEIVKTYHHGFDAIAECQPAYLDEVLPRDPELAARRKHRDVSHHQNSSTWDHRVSNAWHGLRSCGQSGSNFCLLSSLLLVSRMSRVSWCAATNLNPSLCGLVWWIGRRGCSYHLVAARFVQRSLLDSNRFEKLLP
jgi:hypothetical protein